MPWHDPEVVIKFFNDFKTVFPLLSLGTLKTNVKQCDELIIFRSNNISPPPPNARKSAIVGCYWLKSEAKIFGSITTAYLFL